MQNDILSILNESEGLNAKVFSLVRLKLLASLAAPGPMGQPTASSRRRSTLMTACCLRTSMS